MAPRYNYGNAFREIKNYDLMYKDNLLRGTHEIYPLQTLSESIEHYKIAWSAAMFRLNPDLSEREYIEIEAIQFAYDTKVPVQGLVLGP